MTGAIIPPEWHERALCWHTVRAGKALPDDWYAPPTDPVHHAALAVCAQCPVADLCKTQGTGESHGIWAGEYRETYARKVGALPIRHGTPAGATRHRRNGEPPCEDCRTAHADAERERSKRRKAAA